VVCVTASLTAPLATWITATWEVLRGAVVNPADPLPDPRCRAAAAWARAHPDVFPSDQRPLVEGWSREEEGLDIELLDP